MLLPALGSWSRWNASIVSEGKPGQPDWTMKCSSSLLQLLVSRQNAEHVTADGWTWQSLLLS